MRVSVTILDAAIVASPPAKKKRGVARHHVTSEEDVQAANLKKSMGLEVAFSSSSSFVLFFSRTLFLKLLRSVLIPYEAES